jgi:hypothetical protein
MKFLIQKINGEIRHDFSFALLQSIRFKNWLRRGTKEDQIRVKYISTPELLEPDDIYPPIAFKSFHSNYVPVGSVEFVTAFLQKFYGLTPKPKNVPEVLFKYAERGIYNGTEKDFPKYKKFFAKSNSGIKKFAEIVENGNILKPDNYQFSEFINIDSEWRAFIYEGKLVGLQNYTGEFIVFPNVDAIKDMISAFEKSGEAPVAYTLDVGVNDYHTFIIEAHDFFSCGLYGFTEYVKLPLMLNKWFKEYLKKNL